MTLYHPSYRCQKSSRRPDIPVKDSISSLALACKRSREKLLLLLSCQASSLSIDEDVDPDAFSADSSIDEFFSGEDDAAPFEKPLDSPRPRRFDAALPFERHCVGYTGQIRQEELLLPPGSSPNPLGREVRRSSSFNDSTSLPRTFKMLEDNEDIKVMEVEREASAVGEVMSPMLATLRSARVRGGPTAPRRTTSNERRLCFETLTSNTPETESSLPGSREGTLVARSVVGDGGEGRPPPPAFMKIDRGVCPFS